MDPFSVATGAVALMGICASVAHGIKMFIEKAKTSKSTLIKLLEKIEHVRLYLAQLRSIAARLTDPEHKSILIPFDQDACEKTMSKLRALVNKICGAADTGTIKVTLAWTQNKSVAEDLVIELEAQQTHISHALLALTAHSSVVTKAKIEEVISGINGMKITQNPFQEPESLTKHQPSSSYAPSYRSTVSHMWPAHITRDEFPTNYLAHRDKLADASYMGEWSDALRLVDSGRLEFFESWINAARLRQSDRLSELSLWTTLHQAAFLGAPISIVRQMIDEGAFRTLRTARNSASDPLSYSDLTACEIAREMGYHDLLDILAPVIRHGIPSPAINQLQQQLHRCLSTIIADEALVRQLRLPETSALTELESPVVWFPVYKAQIRVWTFQFCLDGRELLLLAAFHAEPIQAQSYRMTVSSISTVEEPLATAVI